MKPLNSDEKNLQQIVNQTITTSKVIEQLNKRHLDKDGNPLWKNEQIAGHRKIEHPYTDIISTQKETGKVVTMNVTTKSPWYENFCVPVGRFDPVEAMFKPNNILDTVDYFVFAVETHAWIVSAENLKKHFQDFQVNSDNQQSVKYLLVPLQFVRDHKMTRITF